MSSHSSSKLKLPSITNDQNWKDLPVKEKVKKHESALKNLGMLKNTDIISLPKMNSFVENRKRPLSPIRQRNSTHNE
jgi:hypothetical protein